MTTLASSSNPALSKALPPVASMKEEPTRVVSTEAGDEPAIDPRLQSGRLIGKVLREEFRLERRIGSGGMGWIYRALQLSIDRPRAVKLLPPHLWSDEAEIQGLLDEASLAAKFESDHTVKIISSGRDDEVGAYMVMELLQGETLARRIRAHGPLSITEATSVVSQLGYALELLHGIGIVHQDLTPNNLFLSVPRRAGVRWAVKLIDFGIAAHVNAGAQRGSAGCQGTLGYMAPEQTDAGSRVSLASDVWSLGVLAFHILTGKHYWHQPPRGQARLAVFRQYCAPLPAASMRARDAGSQVELPPWFDEWFSLCVRFNAAARFPDAGIAAGAFQAFAEASPLAR